MKPNQVRARLLEIVQGIRSDRLNSDGAEELFREARQIMPGNDIRNLCKSDLEDDTIVDVCMGYHRASAGPLSRETLLEIVERFLSGVPFPRESDGILAVKKFNTTCKHPAKSDLIFYPEKHFDGCLKPTAEMIVNLALAERVA